MFRAVVLDRDGEVIVPSIRELDDEALPPGDVLIDVEWSTVNYKDGLAYAGARGVVDQYPIVPVSTSRARSWRAAIHGSSRASRSS